MREKMVLIFLVIAVVCEIINIATSFNERNNAYEKGYRCGKDDGFNAGFDQGQAVTKEYYCKLFRDVASSLFKEEP